MIPDNLKVYSTFEALKNLSMGVDASNYLFKLATMRDSLVRDFHCGSSLGCFESNLQILGSTLKTL